MRRLILEQFGSYEKTENQKYPRLIDQKTAVAIGKFDGIHLGHEKLLRSLKEKKAQGFSTVVFTFDMPIGAFFSGGSYQLLTTHDEKEAYLRELGIDYLAEYPVTKQSVAIAAEDFVRFVLHDTLNAGAVIAGPDCSFGDRGAGDFNLLQAMADEMGYETVLVEKELEMQNGPEISSTYVRAEVEAGRMEHVTCLLGRPYSVAGQVRHGRKLGRKLDMPTVNLVPEEHKLLPPYGVYVSDVHVGSKVYHGVTNIGKKPTVSDKQEVTVETYLYDFDDDLYGEYLQVDLLKFQRPEMKFGSVEELKAQMHQDMENGRRNRLI